MKYLTILMFFYAFLFFPSNVNAALIGYGLSELEVSKDGFSTPEEGIVFIYNSFQSETKAIASKISQVSQKPFLNLLKYMSMAWMLFIIVKSLYNGNIVFNVVFFKTILLFLITFFLNYEELDKYILEPLRMIYDKLPLYISSNIVETGDYNVIQQVFSLYSKQFHDIGKVTSNFDIVSDLLIFIVAGFAMLGLGLVMIRVLFTAFLNTFIFNLILSFTIFWVMLCFFKSTRTFTIQVLNIAIACILQMCFLLVLLTMFNNISIGIFKKLETIRPEKLPDPIISSSQNSFGFTTNPEYAEKKKQADEKNSFENTMVLLVCLAILTFVELSLLKITNEIAGKISTIGALPVGGGPNFKEAISAIYHTGKIGAASAGYAGQAVKKAYDTFKGLTK